MLVMLDQRHVYMIWAALWCISLKCNDIKVFCDDSKHASHFLYCSTHGKHWRGSFSRGRKSTITLTRVTWRILLHKLHQAAHYKLFQHLQVGDLGKTSLKNRAKRCKVSLIRIKTYISALCFLWTCDMSSHRQNPSACLWSSITRTVASSEANRRRHTSTWLAVTTSWGGSESLCGRGTLMILCINSSIIKCMHRTLSRGRVGDRAYGIKVVTYLFSLLKHFPANQINHWNIKQRENVSIFWPKNVIPCKTYSQSSFSPQMSRSAEKFKWNLSWF